MKNLSYPKIRYWRKSQNKILYTCIEDGEYKIYSGKTSSKKFKCSDGSEKDTADIIMDTMEAGKTSYDERRQIYENFEN